MQSFVELRQRLHRIPEPGFQEWKTQALILDYLQTLSASGGRVEVQTWRTGVLVKVKGTNPAKVIGYRADIDGLPIEEETGLSYRSTHPGFMHACGHDMHTAIALGILTHFVKHPMADDLLVIFQPAEEGPGGAKPMLASEEFAKWRPDLIFALHIAPEYPVGTIAVRPGAMFAQSSVLRIELQGLGGHGAMPHQANDMIMASAHLIMQLHSVVARNVDPQDAAVISIGKLESGVRSNIIADKASLTGTIRTFSDATMEKVTGRIRSIVQGVETSFDCQAQLELRPGYCSVHNDEALTEEFMEWVKSEGLASVSESGRTMGGEDFGFFLREIPGFLFWLGVDTPYGLHHAKLNPNESAIEHAITVMTKYIEWKSGQ
ncbi:amidohydrolase [Brevibacillus nitrificans]|uniref:Amidohydrolase n=1 Tax=Brevibacillus nitrificans TaxID=651560 RepID=A0A3M8CXW3_9BACL|nr:N-acetyldiaminopimelate deacetylase [Brevibacillus nitrificans]RNB80533.1 amidohydrolase [Brevibacillus nitrificans]